MLRREFDAAADGEHVRLSCKNHPNLRWSCKKIAISFDANGVEKYNGSRHLFYVGNAATQPECDCPLEDLILVLEDETTPL